MFIAKMALTTLRDDSGMYRKKGDLGTGSQARTVTLKPITDHSDVPEDKDFAKFTPASGSECTLVITNPAVLSQLALGKRFYVTFEEVPEGM